MKRVVLLGLILAFTFCILTSASANNEAVSVFVNGNKVYSDPPAMIVNGSTMLPFRVILNAIGIPDNSIEWRGKSQSIVIRANNKYVFLAINSPGALIDQQMIMLDAAPFIFNNHTMIPVRFISQAFGADVQWDGETGTVNINTNR